MGKFAWFVCMIRWILGWGSCESVSVAGLGFEVEMGWC